MVLPLAVRNWLLLVECMIKDVGKSEIEWLGGSLDGE